MRPASAAPVICRGQCGPRRLHSWCSLKNRVCGQWRAGRVWLARVLCCVQLRKGVCPSLTWVLYVFKETQWCCWSLGHRQAWASFLAQPLATQPVCLGCLLSIFHVPASVTVLGTDDKQDWHISVPSSDIKQVIASTAS